MVKNAEQLLLLASRVVSKAKEEFSRRWCFFAGFAFVLNGVNKKTHDVDILTKDDETYRYISDLLRRIGLEPMATTKDFSSFKATDTEREAPTDLTVDLLCINSEYLSPIADLWIRLENRKVRGISFPVPNPIHLILLKMQVNSHRQKGDIKRQQDLIDVRQLMLIQDISDEEVIEEARRHKLQELASKFLTRMRETMIQGSDFD